MASAASLLPQQQQPQPAAGEVEGNSRSASSGSIGPFFAVMSVLTVVAIISCVLGRICTRGDRVMSSSPLENIKHRDCFGWLKRRCRRRRSLVGEVEVGAKVMALAEDHTNDAKTKDGEVDQDPPQP